MKTLEKYGLTEKHLWTLFMIAVVAVYWPGLINEFNNWDDKAYILNNPNLDFTWDNIRKMFTEGEYHGMYLPITALSFSLNWWLAELSPAPYIIINLVFHLANTWLVYQLVRKLSGEKFTPWLVAMLFALHPVQPESVVYISGRRDVLFTFFFLLASLNYVNNLSSWSTQGYAKTFLFFILAVLSKATAIVFVPALLLYDWLLHPSKLKSLRCWLLKVPFVVVAGLISAATVVVSSSSEAYGASPASFDLPAMDRLLQASYSLAHHFLLVLFPVGQSTIHPFIEDIPSWYLLSGPLFIVFGIGLFKFSSNRLATFGFWFFLVSIFPLIQLFPNSYSIVNEHYLYLPAVGLFLFAAGLMNKLKAGDTKNVISCLVIISVLAVGALKTQERTNVFRSSTSFWTDAIKNHPEKAFFYMKRAMGHEEKYDYDLALLDYNKALEINPNYFGASFNKLDVLFQMRRYAEAEELVNMLLRQQPELTYLRFKRGLIHIELNEPIDAIYEFQNCISRNFELAYSYNNLGLALLLSDSLEAGKNYIECSLELDPNNELARYNMGLYHLFAGDTVEACSAIASSLPLVENPIERQMRYMELIYLCPENNTAMADSAGLANKSTID